MSAFPVSRGGTESYIVQPLLVGHKPGTTPVSIRSLSSSHFLEFCGLGTTRESVRNINRNFERRSFRLQTWRSSQSDNTFHLLLTTFIRRAQKCQGNFNLLTAISIEIALSKLKLTWHFWATVIRWTVALNLFRPYFFCFVRPGGPRSLPLYNFKTAYPIR